MVRAREQPVDQRLIDAHGDRVAMDGDGEAAWNRAAGRVGM